MKFRKRRHRENKRDFFDKTLISLSDLGLRVMIVFVFSISVFHEQGLTVKLPPYSEYQGFGCRLRKQNRLHIHINDKNQILVRNEEVSMLNLKDTVKTFVINYGKYDRFSQSPKMAIVSIQNDRGTKYDAYFEMYHEIKKAYNEMWDEYAQQFFKREYAHLTDNQKRKVYDEIPYVVSESEPINFDYK